MNKVNTEEFKQSYQMWMDRQTAASKGERRRRLKNTANHAEKTFMEKVWWPAFGHFNQLHPEYELRDFKDGWRYLDFAYITEGYKICIEIDGFGSHWRDIDRKQFSDQCTRQNHLVIDGWHVLRFTYDDVVERPRNCQQIIQQLLGKLGADFPLLHRAKLALTEQAIVNLALSLDGPLTPKIAASRLGIHRSTVLRHLRTLVSKQLLMPIGTSTSRVCGYRINKTQVPNVYPFT
ncbi:DUF559 domain-containing protein [Cohnella boryungensis]|uniref:DUF559 domain-containing protein n=1 Tax=Cohnella boryungensis TaxID=768479 RepID=A0ABV8SE28_9BACL